MTVKYKPLAGAIYKQITDIKLNTYQTGGLEFFVITLNDGNTLTISGKELGAYIADPSKNIGSILDRYPKTLTEEDSRNADFWKKLRELLLGRWG